MSKGHCWPSASGWRSKAVLVRAGESTPAPGGVRPMLLQHMGQSCSHSHHSMTCYLTREDGYLLILLDFWLIH